MSTRSILRLASGLLATLAVGYVALAGAVPAHAEDQPGKGKRAQEFIAAFERGDAKAVASFWTESANYVDQTGHEVKGRAALEKLYEKLFAGKKGMKLNIIVNSLRPIGADVALEEGITEVTPPEGGAPSAARFSAVLVKKDGEWYFESVHEAIAQPPSNADHFEDIQWLLGDWTGENEKGESARASYHWAENRNFLVSSFATTLDGVPVMGGTQWIVWDAVDKVLRSFSFYSGGGFAEAVWSKEGDGWSVAINGKSSAGKKLSGTTIITKVDDDHMTWQITKLMADGQSIPDRAPVKLKRVKAERP